MDQLHVSEGPPFPPLVAFYSRPFSLPEVQNWDSLQSGAMDCTCSSHIHSHNIPSPAVHTLSLPTELFSYYLTKYQMFSKHKFQDTLQQHPNHQTLLSRRTHEAFYAHNTAQDMCKYTYMCIYGIHCPLSLPLFTSL